MEAETDRFDKSSNQHDKVNHFSWNKICVILTDLDSVSFTDALSSI